MRERDSMSMCKREKVCVGGIVVMSSNDVCMFVCACFCFCLSVHV